MELRREHAGVFVCLTLILLCIFATLAWLAARTESPTIDEPICTLAGYVHRFDGDFSFDLDNPPLWKIWANIPHRADSLRPASNESTNGFLAATQRLFQTPGNDGVAFIQQSRAMMLIIGVMLGIAIAAWSWQIGGGVAAVVAAALWCFDPNFLAHSPLVKADVTIALLFFTIAWATWSVGKKARFANVAALLLLVALPAVVKYNGLLAILIPLILLPWRIRKPLRGIAIFLVGILLCWGMIWASYGFRFAPRRDGQLLDFAGEVQRYEQTKLQVSGVSSMPLLMRGAIFLERHRLAPQAWLMGLISIYRTTMISRPAFLLGDVSDSGWWYYFPLAMLCKTPLATLAAIAVAAIVFVVLRPRVEAWTILCLVLPPVMYAAVASMSSANGGIRYILPIYPFLYLAVGAAAAKLAAWRPRLAWSAIAVLGAGLMCETLAAFPHYISFFNAAARPQRLYLLGDSNLDWGQDLEYVATWQRANPGVKLYLGYWGPTDPTFYGIEYVPLPGGFAMGRAGFPREAGAVMVSASLLQGIVASPEVGDFYALLRQRTPRGIVGDSIYLYEWPLR